MIEAARQPFGAAAIALIEADHIPTRCPRLIRDTAHVVRHAGAFKAVEEDEGWCAPPAVLASEVTVREHASVGSHVEVPLDGRRQAWKLARTRPRVQRRLVSAGKPWSVRRRLEHRRVFFQLIIRSWNGRLTQRCCT